MRYALIGCGRISPNHIAAAIANGLDIIAISDINRNNMIDTVNKFHLPSEVRLYSDYRVLLKEEKLDLIAIATESGKHAEIALDCIEAGVNIIIEKPIALSLCDADRIIEASEQMGVKICACHQNRFNKSIQKIRQAVDEGRFGKLMYGTAHIRWNRGQNYYTQAPWRGTWEQDGGALMNQCIHNIDLLRWMMGDDIIEVVGFTDQLMHDYIEAEDMGLALIRFKNGSYGIIEGTTNVFPNNLEETLYIFGQAGTIKAGGKSVNIIEEWKFADDLEDCDTVKNEFSENPPNVYGFGHTPLYKDMIEAISENRKPYVDAYAGRRALELVLAIYKSQKEGRSVKLPLGDFSTLNMEGVFR